MYNENMKKNKIIYLAILAFILIIIAIGAFFFLQKKNNNYKIIPAENVLPKNIDNVEKHLEDREGFKIYNNQFYNYKISYPGYLTIDDANLASVGFRDSGYWKVYVTIKEADYTDIEQWAISHKEEMEGLRGITKVEVEKDFYIDYNRALLFKENYVEDYEYDESMKRVFFIKGRNLYEISTRGGIDYEKVWNSFEFVE